MRTFLFSFFLFASTSALGQITIYPIEGVDTFRNGRWGLWVNLDTVQLIIHTEASFILSTSYDDLVYKITYQSIEFDEDKQMFISYDVITDSGYKMRIRVFHKEKGSVFEIYFDYYSISKSVFYTGRLSNMRVVE